MLCDCNVTCLFIVQKKIKKRKESKININSEKLNKRNEKLSVSKAFHNITDIVKLTPISENSIHSKYMNSFPDLILIDKYKEWKAEKILNNHVTF